MFKSFDELEIYLADKLKVNLPDMSGLMGRMF